MTEETQAMENLGWTKALDREMQAYPEHRPARIASVSRGRYLALSATGALSGPLRRAEGPPSTWLAVGDWVALDPENRIAGVLSRKSLLSRKVPGDLTREQLICANADYAFLVQGLDGDFNLRRLERTLAMIHSGGMIPVIVLTKEDLCLNLAERLEAVRAVTAGAMVFSVSAPFGRGMERIRNLLQPGTTAVFLGSSGAGKSTLINTLCGRPLQRTAAVRRDDSRGRHTTTTRYLIGLPDGGYVIDNPGMREIQLWDAEEGIAETFPEIEVLSQHCRFSDCHHAGEPGCAVAAAVLAGTLQSDRLASYHKLQSEAMALAEREARKGKDSARDKAINKAIRDVPKRKRLYGI